MSTPVDKRGKTALIPASFLGCADIAHLLLRTPGIEVNAKDHEYNKNALHWASMLNHAEVVDLLLRAPGINIDATGSVSFVPPCVTRY